MQGTPCTVGAFLLHSYLYYQLNVSRISDTEYDQVCRGLLDRWDDVLTHPHGHLLSKDALSAGTGHHIPEEAYPDMVRHFALNMAANANYLNELKKKTEVTPVDIQFTVRGTDYSITADSYNVTLGKLGKPNEETGIRPMTPLAYVGSVSSAFTKAADHAMKSSDASNFTDAVRILKDIRTDIKVALAKVEGDPGALERKEKPKPKPKVEPEDDFDLDFGDDDMDDLLD